MPETITLLGVSISLYFLFWFLGLVTVVVLGAFLGGRYGYSPSKSLCYIGGTVLLGYLLLWGTSWVFGGGRVSGLNFIRIVTFLPVAIWLLTRLFKDSFRDVSDFLAPLVAIFHGVTHIGCIFPGCCQGYPFDWGLYSNESGCVCFPTQPIEAVSSILIGVILIWMIYHNVHKGLIYSWYLILFGATRFLWEFLRDNHKVWGGISELAFHALGALFVGVLTFFVFTQLYKRKEYHEKNKT